MGEQTLEFLFGERAERGRALHVLRLVSRARPAAQKRGVDLFVEARDDNHEQRRRGEGDARKGEHAPNGSRKGHVYEQGGGIDLSDQHREQGRHIRLAVCACAEGEGKTRDHHADEQRDAQNALQQVFEPHPRRQGGDEGAQRRAHRQGEQGRREYGEKDGSERAEGKSVEDEIYDGHRHRHGEREREVHDVRAQHPRQYHLPAGDGQAHHRVVVFGRKEDGTALEQGKREDDDRGERHDERGQVFAQPLRAEPDGDHGGVEEDHRPDDGKRYDAARRFALFLRVARVLRAVDARQPHQLNFQQERPFSVHRFRAPP